MLTLPSFRKLLLKRRPPLHLGLELTADAIHWASWGTEGTLKTGSAGPQGTLATLVNEQGLEGARTRVVLGQGQYQIFQAERPNVEPGELTDAVRWKLGDLLDYPASEAVIDTFPFPEDASRDRGALINAVCAHQDDIQRTVDTVHAAGLELECIDVAELALRNLLARTDEEGRGAAMVYLGEATGYIVFCRGEVLYMARRLDIPQARLRDAATQEQTVQDLALEVQRSLDYYESQLRQIPPSRVQLAGHPESLPLAGMLNSQVTAEVVDLDWESLLFGVSPEPGSGLAAATLLAAVEGAP
ncbi:hypothetical protein ACMDCT_13935 [Halomonadaceae bacterium KBTZ08]